MILYLPLEVSVRELPGYLLLSVVAAHRGHQVLIASPNDIWLYKRLGLLYQGCYLVKNLNIPMASRQIYQAFLNAGFDLYCQEQEPAILSSKFEKFLEIRNITKSQMLPFKGVFCWGERDTQAYREFFESRGEVFFNTGSPRADLWCPQFSALRYRRDIEKFKPYILVVSNFSALMGKKHVTESIVLLQSLELLDSYQREENFIDMIQESQIIALSMIKAVKYLANKYSGMNILIRPHPTERSKYWQNIFEKNANVRILDTTQSITPLISGAWAVIQNGCTSAVEAVLQEVPVISYGPDRKCSDMNIPNRVGVRAKTIKELEQALEDIMDKQYIDSVRAESNSILNQLVNTEGCKAAFEMIRIMEDRSQFNVANRITPKDILKLRLANRSKNLIDQVRRIFSTKRLETGSYALKQGEVKEDISKMAELLGLTGPKATLITKTGILIEKQ